MIVKGGSRNQERFTKHINDFFVTPTTVHYIEVMIGRFVSWKSISCFDLWLLNACEIEVTIEGGGRNQGRFVNILQVE